MTSLPAASPRATAVQNDETERSLVEQVPSGYWIIGVLLILAPAYCSAFVLLQILGWAMILGMIALSLMFLAGYGGMVSLVQLTIAGIAGYLTAILGTSAVSGISLNWPWWLAVPVALLVAVVFGTLVVWLAVRTAGIYTIMITLAIAALILS